MRNAAPVDSAHAEAAPLLEPDNDSCQRKCSVIRGKSRSSSGALDETISDRAKCYLQHGGETASGKRVTKKLVLACVLAFAFMLFECVGGYLAHSVAILSDAAHMFSDVFSFLVSIYCMRLIKMKATSSYSFGYHRAETIGALISVLIVCVITGGLVLEAIQRLIHPTDIDGRLMFIVATTGIGFNILLLLTLGHDHHHHLGGSCSHDHGHDSGHVHMAVHAHHEAPCHSHDDHAHVHSHMSDEDGCGASHAKLQDGSGIATLQNVDSLQDASHHANEHHHCCHGRTHGRDEHHPHAEGTALKAGCSAVECLSVESTGPSGGLSHVHQEDHSASGCSDTVRLTNGHHCSGHDHSHCEHSHSHHHGHVHSHGGSCGGHHADHHNQNLRGAIVHVLGDILQSVGVAIAGAVIWYTDGDPKWLWVDPACTFVFAISVVWVTKTLIHEITNDLMEAAPSDLDVDDLVKIMSEVCGVVGVHDIHVWRIGTGKIILTAHIDVADKSDPYAIIQCVEDMISAAGISHSTVQICSGKVETGLP